MSNYEDIAINPKTGKMERATWCDDYYGPYHYGVRFADGEVYPEQDVKRVSSLELFAALTDAYERGQRDMRERASFVAYGFDVSENSKMMQPFVEAGLVAHLVRRDNAIGNAIAALPINSEKEGGAADADASIASKSMWDVAQ